MTVVIETVKAREILIPAEIQPSKQMSFYRMARWVVRKYQVVHLQEIVKQSNCVTAVLLNGKRCHEGSGKCEY